MRIFLAVRHSLDPGRFYGSLWSDNFIPALRRLGHEVIESRTDLLPASTFMHIGSGFTAEEGKIRAHITESVLDELRAEHNRRGVDVFLTYFYNSHFEPDGFDVVRSLGIPSINFYCNSIYQLHLADAVSAAVDFAWHPERDARTSYLRAGANPVHVQMGAEPTRYYPEPVGVREESVCFVGMRYSDRERWLWALARAGVPLAIYGNGWTNPSPDTAGRQARTLVSTHGRIETRAGSAASYIRYGLSRLRTDGPAAGAVRLLMQARYRQETRRLLRELEPLARGWVPDRELNRVFSRHALVLNLSNVWSDGYPGSRLIPHVRVRDFEAPMCRVCYVTQHSDEIAELYEPGREIVTYGSPTELVEKAAYYLQRPKEAERVREAGYRRALRDHTWDRRFLDLFQKTGLSRGSRAEHAPGERQR